MKKVMLIEDDPTMLSLLGTLLEMEGYQVVKVQKFDNVLTDVTREMPDAVLMDVHLNDANGLDFLKEIRESEETKTVKVIMSSGMDKSYESKQAGADDFLLKPYMPDELIKKIHGFLG